MRCRAAASSRLRDPDRYGIKADVDVGYLRKINDCWTVGSFLINPTPFGKRAYQMFRGALREQGLSPGNDDGRILTPLILFPEEVGAGERRQLLYR